MNINDAILATTGGPTVNEGLLAYYQANGATSPQLNDAEREFLLVQGAAPAQINDMWFEMLRGLGLTGALSDMQLEFWATGGIPAPSQEVDLPALAFFLEGEGWTIAYLMPNQFTVVDTTTVITRQRCEACDVTGLLQPLATDFIQGMQAQGRCL